MAKRPVKSDLIVVPSVDSVWNPESQLWDQVRVLLRRHFGAGPRKEMFDRCLKMIKDKGSYHLTFDGLFDGQDQLVASSNALAIWVAKWLCRTPDGIETILDVEPDRASVGSPIYNACLETMRTSKGTFFTAEQVAIRIHYTLEPKKRRLRQLRRLLVRVCQDNNGRVKHESKAKVVYGFR